MSKAATYRTCTYDKLARAHANNEDSFKSVISIVSVYG